MNIITTNHDLKALCDRFAKACYITVDTEFMRDNTFWPILCLIQVGTPDEAHTIDPLAKGLDLAPFYSLMENPDILKVFHAARQDIEIFVHQTNRVPCPLFDTQVAAMVCGFGESAGYETLVNRLTGARLDKSARFTDWARRPLTDRQVEYALGDVTHLCTVYEKLAAMLDKNGRYGWLEEEMDILANPETYKTHPKDAWKRLKTRNRNRRFLAMTRALAAWREVEAQTRNIPRNRIMKDETLFEVAANRPNSLDALARLRGITRYYSTSPHGHKLLEVVDEAMKTPESELPKAPPPPKNHNAGAEVELLKLLLKMKSQQHGVATKLIATSSDLEDMATGRTQDSPLLKGWRYELFGQAAQAILRGEMGFAIKNGNIITFPLENNQTMVS